MEKPIDYECPASPEPCAPRFTLKKELSLHRWLVVTAVTLAASLITLNRFPEWNTFARASLALTPFIPGLLYLRDCLRFIRRLDELQARIQFEACLIAAVGTVIVSAGINTLNAQGVRLSDLEHGLSFWGTFQLAFWFWLVGRAVASRRYE